MIQPTDRVLAKVMARVLRSLVKSVDLPSDLDRALLLSKITMEIVGDNKPLTEAIKALINETAHDLLAEEDGRASSNVGSPVATPWNEDAESWDRSFSLEDFSDWEEAESELKF